MIDKNGLHILPAFVDLHTHLRTPGLTHKEDIESCTRAAVRGGYTTLNAMANTLPVCSSAEIAHEVCEKARALGLCDVYQSISATKDFDGKTVSHLDNLNSPFIKCISEDGYGIADGRVFLEVLRHGDESGKVILIHAEDTSLSAIDMYAAEDLETIRDLYLIGLYCEKNGKGNLKVHFCHVSTEYSARAIIAAKKRGLPITFEVSPHHIALNDSVEFRVNPPLRRESDRAFLVKSILNGDVDAIATDHAPHTTEDKRNGAPGLVGLETAFSVCYTVLCRENGLPLEKLSELMSVNPARILGISNNDIVHVDLEREITVDSSTFFSKGRNTPFDGRTYYGEVIKTIKNGEVVYSEH
jgi:dihydroorotase